MILYAEALDRIRKEADSLGLMPSERVGASSAPGRIAAEPIVSRESLPAFDNSSMDGYAVRAAETASAPVRLPVVGTVLAGDVAMEFPPGAVEIMTGAPLPIGFDAVVRVEDVRKADGAIELGSPSERGDYVRYAGTDVSPGKRLVEAGQRLDARHILALAALGLDTVAVRRRPRLALISTGSELAAAGSTPALGKIRNATAAYISAAAADLGAELAYAGSAPDDEAAFLREARKALDAGCDVLLTTGGVSMGRADFVTEAVRGLGAKTVFHKIAIRPGKPLLFAAIDGGPAVFGLPGNPLSTVVGLRFFVVPYLRRRLGLEDEKPRRLKLVLDTPKPEGLRCFFKARADGDAVEALEGQASFRIEPLLRANAWVVLGEEGELAKAGESVDVYPN